MDEKKTVRVEIEHSDGTILRLTGEEAQKWGRYVEGSSAFMSVHGMLTPPFEWEEFRKPNSTHYSR